MKKSLNKLFEGYLKKKDDLFINKKVLQSNYMPDDILSRDKQIEELAAILAPSLKLERPSNVMVYGRPGTGKTCVVRYVKRQIEEIAEKRDLKLKIVCLNCRLERVADTEYRLLAELIRRLGGEVPLTGLPTKNLYDFFRTLLKEQKILLIIILDELNHLVYKIGDDLLYTLVKIDLGPNQSEISLIGISDDLCFLDYLDARIKFSLAEEEIIFPPYNALQLQKILKQRAKQGFKKGALEKGVIEKCAAMAAREHGDAGRAIALLRTAGELAERRKQKKIRIKDLDEAEGRIEQDRLLESVRMSTKQMQMLLYSILCLRKKIKREMFTGDVYESYIKASKKCGLRPLSRSRVSYMLSELDMLGLIYTAVISKGKHGRTRRIRIDLPKATIKEINKVLEQGLNLKHAKKNKT